MAMKVVSEGYQPRGRGPAALLSVPIVLGVGLMLAGAGLFVFIYLGGTAKGGVVRYELRSKCGAEAREAVFARLADFGLPVTPFGADLDLQVQLPGQDADEFEHLPKALTRPGSLDITVDGKPFPAKVRHTGFQVSLTTGAAVTLLTLDTAPPAQGVEVKVDGVLAPLDGINGGELMLSTTEADPRIAVREATERAVALRHPLPCAVELVSATRVSSP